MAHFIDRFYVGDLFRDFLDLCNGASCQILGSKPNEPKCPISSITFVFGDVFGDVFLHLVTYLVT